MLRGIWGDPERYQRDVLESRFAGRYFAGDGAKRDDDGYFWLLGRVDDVMNVSGHRISTTEVESALVDHPAVAEAAVVGANDADDRPGDHRLRHPARRQRAERRARRGAARARRARRSARSPSRRRSSSPTTCPRPARGKIMRRLLRDVAEDQALGDTTTLADPRVVEGIKARYLASRRATRTEPDVRRGTSPSTGPGATGRSSPGPAVVFDIDGVLSDAASRQHYLEAPRRDWDAFFDACGDDPVIEEVARAPRPARPRPAHRAAHRPARARPRSSPRRGCAATSIRWDLLVMRPWGDYELRPRLQAVDACGDLRDYGFDLRLAFEDDRRNVEMFRREGVPCVYFHSGYYD